MSSPSQMTSGHRSAHYMHAKLSGVPRPLKKAGFEFQFATRQAEHGWHDLPGGQTQHRCRRLRLPHHGNPQDEPEMNHQLKGGLATLNHKGEIFARWQLELPCGTRLVLHRRAVPPSDGHPHAPPQRYEAAPRCRGTSRRRRGQSVWDAAAEGSRSEKVSGRAGALELTTIRGIYR